MTLADRGVPHLPPAAAGAIRPATARAAAAFAALAAALPARAADGAGGVMAVSTALGAVALGLAGALGVVAGVAWGRWRFGAELRAVHQRNLALEQLVDGWQWRSDADHQVVQALRPAGHGGAASTLPPAPQHAIEAWLAGRQARGEALIDVPIADGTTQPPLAWTVRAVARTDDHGRFAGYHGTARPMGDERVRRADQAALDVLLRALPGALWIADADPADGRLVVRRCNEAAARMAGGDVTGIDWSAMLDRLPKELEPALRGLEPGAAVTHGAWQVHLERIAMPGQAGEGRLLALLPQAGDAAAAAAAAADQESFSYTVSHDLRAPLRVVEGFTRIVKEDYGRSLDRIGNDHLDRVLGAAARMNHMIDALLALARLSSQPLARQPVNLSQLAGFVVDDLRRQHPDRVVDVAVQPGLTTHGDPTLLRMMLENLLGNAWKYSAKVARAEIALERVRHDGRDAYLVRDNGAGFDMRFADRLFGVFQRLHSSSDFQGTGVGLASVRRIVRRHGGDIWAESEVGRGARFYFTLAP